VSIFQSPERAIATILVILVMLLVAFPVHEFAHAFVAHRLGDGTAKLFGRLSLDPRVHFDPMGGLLLVVTMAMSGFGFGWAKPTPVNPQHLQGGHRGEALVAFAGPASNLVLASIAAIPYRLIVSSAATPDLAIRFLETFIVVNVALMLFNLIPLPPLDGSKVLYAFLSPATAWRVRPVLEQYGTLLLLFVVFFPLFGGQTLIGLLFEAIGWPLIGFLVGA
jgi:Zn-dependent protease